MRPTCTHCALKHLSQASILLSESRQGYPTHRFYALGHMAEAGDELVAEYPKYAELVRSERKKLEEDDEYSPDFDWLLNTIDEECSVCQLEPGSPRASTLIGQQAHLSGSQGVRRNPSCESKIASCVLQLEDDPHVRNPYAVCRASIKCPP